MSEKQYFNRELSWLEFNARVLDQAINPQSPLLERLRFIGIVASNFDEFFMVRVAAIKSAIRSGETSPDVSGMAPAPLLQNIVRRVRGIVEAQYGCLMKEILPDLARKGLALVRQGEWTVIERRWLEHYFDERVFPLLTPLRIDDDGFPSTGNLRIHVAFVMKDGSGEEKFAMVQVPSVLDRFVRLESETGSDQARYALLEDVIDVMGHRLFPGSVLGGSAIFKVTRDADSPVDEERDEDFLTALEDVLAGRQNSLPVRLTVSGRSDYLAERLRIGLELNPDDVYRLPGPVDLRGFTEWAGQEGLMPDADRLRNKPWSPVKLPEPEDSSAMWESIRTRDRLIHVPYESFEPVIRFLDTAADDPDVLAIKMTLYRTSGDSPIIRALTRAARNRKQVCVIVELKARFDEERNISWSNKLEQAGAIVVYGIAGLKVHAKAALVVRKERNGEIGRYLHLSTGNYNDKTARQYSDLSILTANPDLCREASLFFNAITGYSSVQRLKIMAAAPFDLKERLLFLIEREVQRSSPESPGLIMVKLNAIADPVIIDALYRAGRAGVRIMLNIRGVCTLIPGEKGLSEHITVVSVLGRYLEHARILYFYNGGTEEVYLSSADWLPRNLERRVELLFPVLDETLRKRVIGILESYFLDTVQSYRLTPSGRWQRIHPQKGVEAFQAQAVLYQRVKRMRDLAEAPPEELVIRRRQGS
ncbi:MAG: polyphosphate kinase 1 [Rectinemataceae bacterium]|nr:polyphosphate kinase 1 [Rectinemataceae bacterium]